jgi:hypothetical protein
MSMTLQTRKVTCSMGERAPVVLAAQYTDRDDAPDDATADVPAGVLD